MLEQLEPRMLLSGGSIKLGPQTGFIDQPYIEVELIDEGVSSGPEDDTPIGPYGSGYGIYPYNRMLLDTGANSVLVVSNAVSDLASNGYQTEGLYREVGVAGYTEFDVSAPYRLDFRGSDDVTHSLPQTAEQNRILSSASVHLGSPADVGGIPGIVGMPAMVDRVTTLDISVWADATDIFDMQTMGVYFADDAPEGNGHRYSVALDNRVAFDPADGLPDGSPPGAPLPVWADVPFLTAVAEFQGTSLPGNFLLDTGAQFSVISSTLAFGIGLDTDGDGNFDNEKITDMTVGGIGGTIDAPVLVIDKLRLPTNEGPELVWQIGDPTNPEDIGIAVLVLDIASGIDGVFGVDMLVSGLDFLIDPSTLEISIEGATYFEKIHFDFRGMSESGSGTMLLDLNPDLDAAKVVGRHVFYNDSYFDGNDPAANAGDDAAIATDKTALLPGQTATFANYTSYSRGINGIMVDIEGLADPSAVADGDFGEFTFKFGNDDTPGDWLPAPDPADVEVRDLDGGVHRVTFTWADNAIPNRNWLQVTVKEHAATGLAVDDVFYFGNSAGETSGNFVVNYDDLFDVIWPVIFTTAPVDGPADVNRDGVINYNDLYNSNAWWDNIFVLPPLAKIAPPAAPAPAPLLESLDSVFGDDALWAAEIVWFDELYGTANGSEKDDVQEETAVDGVFAGYYDL